MRIALLCLLSTSTLVGCYDDCHPRARKSLTLGTGEQSYIALDQAAPVYDLIHGPQDGYHVIVGMQASGLDATQIVTADITGSVGGEQLAHNDGAWLTFQCSEESGALQAWNTFLIYDVETGVELDGQKTQIHATVTDVRGVSVEADVEATFTYEEDE